MKFRRGIVLLELVVTIVIMVMILIVIVNLYISSGAFVTNEQLRIDVSQNASRALSGLDETLRQGKAVLTSATYNSTTYTTGDSTLVISVPSLLSDGSLSPTEIDTMIVYLDTTISSNYRVQKIIASLGTGSTRSTGSTELVTGVKDLYFRYNADTVTSATEVTATVTTQKTVNARPFTTATILNATLRNHP